MLNKVIASRYRILERVGIGGMAEVYKAQDEVLGRIDAVKVLLPQFASDPTFAARFRQEAQAAANLTSPYIVGIYDWGLDGETYYLVMEYIRGVDLKTAITQRGAIGQRKVAQIASQICTGLAVAHDHDVIHRDIKPQNIMIQPDGNIKIMDFGVARAGNSTMTQTGSVLGTANYVSPEQAQGKVPTAASDLYSLGILMYEAATGKLPFEGPDAISVALKQVSELPVPPSTINPAIDPAFESIILKALEKDPANRFGSAEEMRTAINNYLNGNPVNIGPVAAGGAAATQVLSQGGTTKVLPVSEAVKTSVMTPIKRADDDDDNNGHNNNKKGGMSNKAKAGIVVAIVAVIAAICCGVVFLGGGQEDTVTVPNVLTQDEATARSTILSSELAVGDVTYDYSDTVKAGIVMKQTPEYGNKVAKGTSVSIVVSKGTKPPNSVTVPDLTGMTAAEAGKALASSNLTSINGGEQYSDTVKAGYVCAQDPAAGNTVDEGTKVTFYISKGVESVTVPDFAANGYSENGAKQKCSDLGLTCVVKYQYSSTVAQGLVLSQDPVAGKVSPGSTITVYVSMGPEPSSDSTSNNGSGSSSSSSGTSSQ